MQNQQFQSQPQPSLTIPVSSGMPQPSLAPIITPSKNSNLLKTSLLILALALFGALLGVLAFNFLPLPTFLDKTAKWPTYFNPGINVALRYPPTWSFLEAADKKSVVFNTSIPSLESRNGDIINYSFSVSEESRQNYELWSNKESTKQLPSITRNGYGFERYIVFDKFYSLIFVNKISEDKYILYSLYPYTETERPTVVDNDIIQLLTSYTSCEEPTILTQCNKKISCLPVGAECN